MFKNKLLVLLILAMLLAFAGCSKKNDASATTTPPVTETGTVYINEEQTLDTTLVGTWEEIVTREPVYDEIIITETYNYIFNEDGTCKTVLVKCEMNVTKEEYVQIGSEWIEEKWDAKTIKKKLDNKNVETIEEYLTKEYDEYMVTEVEEIYFGLWSVEDGVLYSWTDGTAKADGISTEITIETDFVTVNGIQFNRVK